MIQKQYNFNCDVKTNRELALLQTKNATLIFVTHRKASREREWARFGGGFGRMFRNPWYSAGKSGVPRPDPATVYQQNN